MDIDDRELLRKVVRAVERVRPMRPGERVEDWHAAVSGPLEDARELLGAFGEGKALSRVVALCTHRLEWTDLSQVGVIPTSERPWKTLQDDLVDSDGWCARERRARLLKMLRKLSTHLGARPRAADAVSILEFCAERGILASTLRGRLRRHNDRATGDIPRIEPLGEDDRHRQLYDRDDLRLLLTDAERARCP